MHVDRVPVRHVDPHLAEGIVEARVLAQGVVHRPLGRPVDGGRLHLLALPVEHADVHLGEITRVLAHVRDDVLLDEGHRHGPGRVEVDVGDPRLDHGRGAFRLAHHRDVAARDAAVIHRLDGGRRMLTATYRSPNGKLDPIRRLAEAASWRWRTLAGTLRAATVWRPEKPGLGQVVTRLEALERRHEAGIELVALRAAGREVLGHHEMAAQKRDRRVALAGLHREVGRQRRPAAGLDQALVALGRPQGVEEGRRGQRRGGVLRHPRHDERRQFARDLLGGRPALAGLRLGLPRLGRLALDRPRLAHPRGGTGLDRADRQRRRIGGRRQGLGRGRRLAPGGLDRGGRDGGRTLDRAGLRRRGRDRAGGTGAAGSTAAARPVPSIQATAPADVRYGNATRNTITGLGQGRPPAWSREGYQKPAGPPRRVGWPRVGACPAPA